MRFWLRTYRNDPMQRPVEESPFVRRFDAVCAAVLRMRIAQGICWGVFVAGSALVTLAAADYVWELPRSVRVAGLAVALVVALVVTAVGVFGPILWWSRPRTAKELESQFPQLGQRVRTVVQFSGCDSQSVTREGVKPGLVAALEEDTDFQAQPLDLREIVPRRQPMVAAVLATIPVVVVLAGLLLDWQWRWAICRALLSNRPYTTLAVKPGDVLIDQGHDLTLLLTLSGRVDRQVSLLTRKIDDPDAPWQQEELSTEEIRHHWGDDRRVEYAVTMDNMTAPLDYRFCVGSIQDESHHITIRYPLALQKFEATLTPPRYTGLSPKTVAGGDLAVIEDSEITFLLEFDRKLRDAYLLVSDPPYQAKDGSETPPAVRVPLQPGQDGLVATLRLRDDEVYSIVATAREGGPLPENQYCIRIHEDQSPRVHFEDPPEAWEVNPIAEVPMRIRVDDDFGVSKAGIVLQIDNGNEERLLTKEYSINVEPDADGKIQLTTHAALTELLCLEKFPLTETSAVTYYAYVEDNYPEKPKRVETDLRFIEIRPFRRFFKSGGT